MELISSFWWVLPSLIIGVSFLWALLITIYVVWATRHDDE